MSFLYNSAVNRNIESLRAYRQAFKIEMDFMLESSISAIVDVFLLCVVFASSLYHSLEKEADIFLNILAL